MDRQLENEINSFSGRERKPDASINRATFFDPDKRAEVIKLAESRNLPIEFVQNNVEEVSRQEKYDKVKIDQKTHPKVYNYMIGEANSQVSIDDVDNLKGMEDAIKKSEVGLLSNTMALLLNTTNELTGNLLEFAGHIDENISKDFARRGVPNPGFYPGEDGMEWSWDLAKEGEYKSGLKHIGKAISDTNTNTYGYVHDFTWEKFKGDINVKNLTGYAFESFGGSLPHMLSSIYAFPAYIASRTQGIAEKRVKNDKRSEVLDEDLAQALIPALTIGMLERYASKFIFKPSKGGIAKAFATGAAVEGVEEFVHEGIEYLGETIGTKKKISMAEMFDRQMAGLVAGSVIGGTIKSAGATFEAVSAKLNKNLAVNIESMGEQEIIDQIITFSQSSKTRERMGDRFGAFVESLGSTKQIHISNEAISDAIEQGIELPPYITDQLGGVLTDITISVDKFARDIAANDELMSVIREHIKLNPNTLTQSEIKEEDELSVKSLLAKATKEKEVLTESQKIYEDVKDQIVDTGRQSELTAKFSASIIPKWVAQKVKSTGKSAKEIYAMMGLKVVSEQAKIETKDKVEIKQGATKSGISYKQDFGDIVFKEKRTLSSGKTVSTEQPAKRVWERGIKRRNQAIKLKACLNELS